MRALFTNAMNDAVLSATASSINYPIESVIHRYKRKRWQCLISNSVITCIFNDVKSINCIFYAYHTLATFEFELFDSLDNSLYSGSDTDIKDIGMSYFPKVDNVKKIVFTVTATDVLRIGTLWCGEYVTIQYFNKAYKPSYEDNSTVTRSSDFQYSQLYIEPAFNFEFTIPDQDDIETEFYMQTYNEKSGALPFFIDISPNDRLILKPRYAVFNGPPDVTPNGIRYNVLMKIREAR